MRSQPVRRVLIGLIVFAVIGVIAVAGYVRAGWSVEDAIYFVVITIFGVGYGEVQPVDSTMLRALTIAVIVIGYGAVIYVIGGFIQILIDGELESLFRDRKMKQEIAKLDEHTIICGYGRMGSALAEELAQKNIPFVIIDNSTDAVEEAVADGHLILTANATEEEVLEEAKIENARCVATLLPDDAMNAFICLNARELKPDLEIISRGESKRVEKKLLRCGANHVVMAASIGAKRAAQLITRPSAASLLRESGASETINDELASIGLQMEELKIDAQSPLVGNTLERIEVRGNRGFLIVAVRSKNGNVSVNPPCETVLVAGDVVIVVGYQNDIADLCVKHIVKRQKTMTYRGATVPIN